MRDKSYLAYPGGQWNALPPSKCICRWNTVCPAPLLLRLWHPPAKRNVSSDKSECAWEPADEYPRTQTPPRLRAPASPESASPLFCRTNNRRSLFPSRRRFIQPDDHGVESFFSLQFVGKLLRRLLARNFPCAHAIKSAFINGHLLNRRWRI